MRTPPHAHTTVHNVPYRLGKPAYWFGHAAILIGFAVTFNVLIARLWESDGPAVYAYDAGIALGLLAACMAAGCLEDHAPDRKEDMA